jgi:integrase
MSKRQTWSWSTGDRGSTVRVFEIRPGSVLYMAVWDPTRREGRGDYARRSLGHRDKRRAREQARQAVARLEAGELTHRVTLGYLVDLYLYHELEGKAPGTVKWLRQHLATWVTYLGRQFPVADFGAREWEAFKRQRLNGAIDAHGHAVEPTSRRAVRPGTVNLGLDALTMLFNWACRWRVDGIPLLDRNPAWKLPSVDDPNQRRSVWTWDRFQKVVGAAEKLTMQVEWHGRRQWIPCYLADILVIAEGTGRRIGAVRQLRYQDLRLDDGSHGKIAWPADTDKKAKEWLTPIAPAVRTRLVKVIRERPGLGAAPLFPAPRNLEEPVGRDTLASWQRNAEKVAGVPRLPHDSFHGLRRKFVVERKHLPDVDVAAAGGWRSVATMKRTYQLADEGGVLEAVMEPKRLRERGA